MGTPLFYVTRVLRCTTLGAAILYSFHSRGQTQNTPAVPPSHPVFPTGADTPLGAQITALLEDPSVSRAHWGIAVMAMDGTPLYGLDEGKFFRPASNAKLFTTAAAMALIGPKATVGTKILGNIDATGTVTSDLILVGAGDANLASDDLPYVEPSQRPKNQPQPPSLDDLRALADQLVAKGVRRVSGHIVGDDTLFPREPFADSWDVGDLVWGYGAPVSALTIADNELKLTVTPGTISGPKGSERYSPVTVALQQNDVPYYTVESQIETTPKGTGSHINVERMPGSRVLRVYGSMAADAEPDVEHVSIDDPALYAAMALRQMLIERGVAVDGEATVLHRQMRDGHGFLNSVNAPLADCEQSVLDGRGVCPASCPVRVVPSVLASHPSAPLAEDVTLTLKVSQNLHAELLLHRLGSLSHGPCTTETSGSTAEGARMVRAFLLRAGLDAADFVFYDGSGLSGHDLVTPRATAQLLAYAAKQPWFGQWKAALPVGGEDGTLSSRFPDAPLKDHLFAKTGTLGESRGLSGYVDTASGKQVIFSIFVDDHAPNGSKDREVMDKIVAAIAANE